MKDGTPISGATASTLEFAAAQPADAGAYHVIVSAGTNTVVSTTVTLSVHAPPTFNLGSPGTVIGLGGPAVPAGLNDVVSIAAGERHALALRSNGTVVEWGNFPPDPYGGPLGRVPAGLSNVVAIAAGGNYSLALRRDGTVVSWGGYNVPAEVYGAVAIAAGENSGLAVRTDGRVIVWGAVPAPPEELRDVIAVATTRFGPSLALRSDGSAFTWGSLFGIDPSLFATRDDLIAIAVGRNHVMGLRNDGTVLDYLTGGHPPSAAPADLSGVTAISASEHGLALKSDGTVVGWSGADLPAGLQHVSAIAAGMRFTLLVTTWPVISQQPQSLTVNGNENGALEVAADGAGPLTLQWHKNGLPISGETNLTLSKNPVQEQDAGDYTVTVSNSSGTVTSVVATLTVLTVPAVISNPLPQTVFAGGGANFTVRATGAAPLRYQWRRGGTDLAGATNETLVLTSALTSDAGQYSVLVSNHHGVTLSEEATLKVFTHTFPSPTPGTVVSLGGPLVPLGLHDAIAVAAGRHHSLAVRSDGTVVEWGYPLPPGGGRVPPDLTGVVAVAAGWEQSVALRGDGTLASWGGSVPPNLQGIVAIAVGDRHGLALKVDGTVVGWGQITPPPNLTNVVAIAAGGLLFPRSVALRSDGSAVVWGSGPPFLPAFSDRNDLVAVAAGNNHVMALVNDGTVLDYFDGRSTNAAPSGLSDVVAIAAGDPGSLALKSDGTVVGWNGLALPPDLGNVSVIAAGHNHQLLITPNPPTPVLGAGMSEGHFVLQAPVSVSGFVVETVTNLTQPNPPTGVSGSIITFGNTSPSPAPTTAVPTNGSTFYRLRLVQ